MEYTARVEILSLDVPNQKEIVQERLEKYSRTG